jgi:hypothetical protein
MVGLVHYRDPDEPTSEVYRLMPPSSSQLREALDAATGNEPLAAGANGGLAAKGTGQAETRPAHPVRTMLGWLDSTLRHPVIAGVIAAVIAGLILAIMR